MKKWSHKEGFTLVEVLVVCMIIAIIGAMTIPSFSGYITSQKEKAAIKECHVVVAAAQSHYTELYTKNNLPQNASQRTDAKTVIMKTADTNGKVRGDINYEWKVNEVAKSGDSTAARQKVIWLAYEAENGLHVVYNADRSGAKYYLSDETWTDTDATTESTTATPTTATTSSTEVSSATTETDEWPDTVEGILRKLFSLWINDNEKDGDKYNVITFVVDGVTHKIVRVSVGDNGHIDDLVEISKDQCIVINKDNNDKISTSDDMDLLTQFVDEKLKAKGKQTLTEQGLELKEVQLGTKNIYVSYSTRKKNGN